VIVGLGEAPAPDELERTLAEALGDPTLHIVFALPEGGRFVYATGASCDRPAALPWRTLTRLDRGGEPVAWIEHDSAIDEAIEPALTPALRLSLDNARLRAALLAQIRELRNAQRKVVLDGDDERRRLERDLHDGVQQQLLALGAELHVAARVACTSSDVCAGQLNAAVDETTTLLEEVRVLAHGIYPAILTDGGLAPAVASLADVARLPVEIARAPTRRYAPSVETAAYHVVAESVENALLHSNASSVEVALDEQDGALVVLIHDDGHGGAAVQRVGGLVELVDRVGAIDGTLSVASPAGRGTTISAVIPCAS
jgi:signal transduction histidine kinase